MVFRQAAASVLRTSARASTSASQAGALFSRPLPSTSACVRARPTAPAVRAVDSRRAASSVSSASSTDPRDKQANDLLAKGIECFGSDDIEGAVNAYKRSIEIKETPAALYNMALTLYQMGRLEECIAAFERSVTLQPSADAHTNVASAYILSTPPNAVKAIEHLQKAHDIDPEDGEINFNMGVVFEATGKLEDALREYNQAQKLGIERAAPCIRNVGGKILEKSRASASS